MLDSSDSAFLALAAGSSMISQRILPAPLANVSCPFNNEALALWSQGHDTNLLQVSLLQSNRLGIPLPSHPSRVAGTLGHQPFEGASNSNGPAMIPPLLLLRATKEAPKK